MNPRLLPIIALRDAKQREQVARDLYATGITYHNKQINIFIATIINSHADSLSLNKRNETMSLWCRYQGDMPPYVLVNSINHLIARSNE